MVGAVVVLLVLSAVIGMLVVIVGEEAESVGGRSCHWAYGWGRIEVGLGG